MQKTSEIVAKIAEETGKSRQEIEAMVEEKKQNSPACSLKREQHS